MTGFYLLLGHLIGDYILQTDWMARNKAAAETPMPKRPGCLAECEMLDLRTEMEKRKLRWLTGLAACGSHCLAYTLAVWACTYWWMPGWGLYVCFFAHYAVDRWRLAAWWMTHVSFQSGFAWGKLNPWSIVIVDNVMHLMVLGAIAAAEGVPC